MKNIMNIEKLRSWETYVIFLIIGIISPPVSIFTLPNFIRLEGIMQLYAALAFNLILIALAFYFLTNSLTTVFKAVGMYLPLFFLLFLGFSNYTFSNPLLTFIILPIFMILPILSRFRRSENIIIARIVSLTILTSFLVFMAFLGYAAHQHYTAKYIHVSKLELPEYYVNLTDKIDEFASLKELNFSQDYINAEMSLTEMAELEELASRYTKSGDAFFYAKVDGNYFKVWLIKLVGVEILTEEQTNYVVVNKSIKCCPILINLMNKAKEIKKEIEKSGNAKKKIGKIFYQVSLDELEKVKGLIDKGSILKFGEDYFIVFINCSVRMRRIVIPECNEITNDELQMYPTLKNTLITAEKKGNVTLKIPPEEWSKILSFVKEKGCIKFNGSNFTVKFMLS